MADFAVSHAAALGEQKIRARTTVAGDTLEPWDAHDCANPRMWVLRAGTPAPANPVPLPIKVTPRAPGTAVDDFEIELDAPLDPLAGYTLRLHAAARAYGGEPTSEVAASFVALRVSGPAGLRARAQGADVSFPPTAGASGDLDLFDREAALRHRLSAIVLGVRKGAFRFAETEDVGRGFEPKRSYSAAALAQEAARLRALLERDQDVKIAAVAVDDSGHLTEFQITVVPKFSARAVPLQPLILAGGDS